MVAGVVIRSFPQPEGGIVTVVYPMSFSHNPTAGTVKR